MGQMAPPAAGALLLERLPSHQVRFGQDEEETQSGLSTFLNSVESNYYSGSPSHSFL